MWLLAIALFAFPLFAQNDPLWDELKKGNDRFMTDKVEFGGLIQLRKDLAPPIPGQQPPYTILSCSDSRVPPELVFALQKGLGQLFVVRAAGNVADTFGIASIEFAIAKGWTKMIVVLGHEGCGAVEAAIDRKDPGSPALLALVTRIRESFVDRKAWTDVRLATEANARYSLAQLLANSSIIREAVLSGRVQVAVAYYNLERGNVVRID